MGIFSRYGRKAIYLSVAAIFIANTAKGADFFFTPSTNGGNIATDLASIPNGASATAPNRMILASGTYTQTAPAVQASSSQKFVDIIGATGNAADVVIAGNFASNAINPATSMAYGTSGSAVLTIKGNDISMANVTVANTYDTPQTTSTPAVGLLVQGDEDSFRNVTVLGYQDTLYVKGGRNYFLNSYVNGDDDAIFASGTAVFDHLTFNNDGSHSGGAMTAASTDKKTSNGLVFLNSTLTSSSVRGNPIIDPLNKAAATVAASSLNLGRPWGWTQVGGDASTVLINTTIDSSYTKTGWIAWDTTETASSRSPGLDSRYAEFNSTNPDGTPYVSTRPTWAQQLSASQAAAYTIADLFSRDTGGVYNWFGSGYPNAYGSNPQGVTSSFPAFWGDRNVNNESATDTTLNNPTSYTDPSWTVTADATWDPTVQLATDNVPEPASLGFIMSGAALLLGRRSRPRHPVAD
jgi:pectin methylesterase-like acyl-CoA thioesterase